MGTKIENIAASPEVQTFAAAALGSVLGLRALPGQSLAEKAWNLCCGFLLAVYLGPAAAEYWEVHSPRLVAAIVFLAGAAGLVLFGAVIEGIRQTSFGDLILSYLAPRRKPAQEE